MYALLQHGLDVPGDVAVTGFDDIPVARHLRPQLTTVRQPIQELGATAFEVLYSMINDAGHCPAQHRPAHPAGRPRELRMPPRPGHAPVAGGLRGDGMRVIVRRLLFYIVTAILAVTVTFFIPRLMPGNPVEAVLAHLQGNVTPATIRSLELQYGLDSPQGLWGQYTTFWVHLVHGNLGVSTSYYPSSVTSVIRSALPWTIGLVGLATVISFVLGTVLGVLVAWRRGTWLDSLLPVTTFFQAAPYFFVAFIALDVFATRLGWFPTGRAYGQLDFPGWNAAYVGDVLEHAILPAATIVLCSAAGWIVGMRNVMVTTMDEDYVLVAQAKGLPKRRVIWYAARNAILPSVSGFSLAIGFVVSGALLTEIVFSYPGLGWIMLQAVAGRDYPLLQGIFLIITFAVLLANLAADSVYVFLDPRTRQEA